MGYKWRKTLKHLDCRPKPFQLSSENFPKNTTQCNFFCPYYLLCRKNPDLKKECPMSYPQAKVLTENIKVL